MSEQEKTNLKNKGKKFVDDNLGSLKNAFGGNRRSQAAHSGPGTNYGNNGPQM